MSERYHFFMWVWQLRAAKFLRRAGGKMMDWGFTLEDHSIDKHFYKTFQGKVVNKAVDDDTSL